MRSAETRTLTIDIRPRMSILGVLQSLNYQAWYAMAEFVDNALQSFLANREGLVASDGSDYQFQVTIEHDRTGDGRILITDNAAGIDRSEFGRAFTPGDPPIDRSGLSEFGMGMKSAACWFARRWRVRTTTVGDPLEYTVDFDVDRIASEDLSELDVTTAPVDPAAHFTVVELLGLNQRLHSRTVGKVKSHLASIYRVFLRSGDLRLVFDGQPLAYDSPAVLEHPLVRDPAVQNPGTPILRWEKPIDLDFGGGQRVHGFVAIREQGDTARAGLALLRRDRLIYGSDDDGWKPEPIFGRPNSFRSQRVFGELNVEGFAVSHSKDGFRWQEHEYIVVDELRKAIDAPPLPILRQAESYRARPRPADLAPVAERVVSRTAEVVRREVPRVVEEEILPVPPSPTPVALPQPSASLLSQRTVELDVLDEHWVVELEMTLDPAVMDWVSVSSAELAQPGRRRVSARLSLAHPFSAAFGGPNGEHVDLMFRLAVALAVAQEAARLGPVRYAGVVVRNLNTLLRDALCHDLTDGQEQTR